MGGETGKEIRLEDLASDQLFELLMQATITYRDGLVSEGNIDYSADYMNKRRREEYLQRTRQVRAEINRRFPKP